MRTEFHFTHSLKRRFHAYKRLKSSLWLSSPFPSDTMLSSLSISSASTYTQTHTHIQPSLSAVHVYPSENYGLKVFMRSCHSHLFEVAIFPLLPIHHVMENWDHDISNLSLRHQCDAKEGTHHSWDEVGLVVTWLHRFKQIKVKLLISQKCRSFTVICMCMCVWWWWWWRGV